MRKGGLVALAIAAVLLVALVGIACVGEHTLMEEPDCLSGDCDLVVMTWNVRGYPEKTPIREDWFSQVLEELSATVLFVQEIGDEDDADTFLASEEEYAFYSCTETSSHMDNAVFFHDGIAIIELDNPLRDSTSATGFVHPPEVTSIKISIYTIVLISVHLTWDHNNENGRRTDERELLEILVQDLRYKGYEYFIVAGDFNTTEVEGDTIQGLADMLDLEILPHSQTGVGTTYASELKKYDHILASETLADWATGSCIVVFDDSEMAKNVSNHRPVIACFDYPDRPDDDGPPSRFTVAPNPFTEEVRFRFVGEGVPDVLTVIVVDLQGRPVWTATVNGVDMVLWDGVGQDGETVAAGPLIYQLEMLLANGSRYNATGVIVRRPPDG